MSDTTYISKADYKYQIRTTRLDQILESADEDEELILDNAETEALAMISKHLVNYNMAAEYATTGAARNKVVLRWAKVLVIYYIYERVPDEMVPERVVKNYDEVMEMLANVEKGKAQVPGLTPVQVTDPETGESSPATRRRWGSVRKRTNDGGSPRYRDL